MLFFYLRHGDPIYDPDSLTPLGERQAEALGKRLASFGLDKIYTSTSIRAQETARPTCEMLKKEAELLDFANEGHAWNELTTPTANGGRTWLFHHADSVRFFHDPELLKLGHKWYDHPRFEGCNYEKGLARIAKGADELFASLGYEHITGTGTYKPVAPNDQRVALFALFQNVDPLAAAVFRICPQLQEAFLFQPGENAGHRGMGQMEFSLQIPGTGGRVGMGQISHDVSLNSGQFHGFHSSVHGLAGTVVQHPDQKAVVCLQKKSPPE